jgi:hypothetical protein
MALPIRDSATTGLTRRTGIFEPLTLEREPCNKNCTALHKRYPHGVGKVGARDKTMGTPVTTFKRSNRLYSLNKGLDRDKDGFAREKR